jgi:hypothetical protein
LHAVEHVPQIVRVIAPGPRLEQLLGLMRVLLSSPNRRLVGSRGVNEPLLGGQVDIEPTLATLEQLLSAIDLS